MQNKFVPGVLIILAAIIIGAVMDRRMAPTAEDKDETIASLTRELAQARANYNKLAERDGRVASAQRVIREAPKAEADFAGKAMMINGTRVPFQFSEVLKGTKYPFVAGTVPIKGDEVPIDCFVIFTDDQNGAPRCFVGIPDLAKAGGVVTAKLPEEK